MNIDKKNLLYIFISLLFLFFSVVLENILIYFTEFEVIIRLSLFLLIFPSYFFLLSTSYKLHSSFAFLTIFFTLSFFFYYGQYILIVFGYYAELSREYVSLVCGKIDYDYVIKALYIHIRALLFFYIGYLFVIKRNKVIVTDTEKNISVDIPIYFKKVALFLLFISGICMFIVLSYNMTLGSYAEMRNVGNELYRFSSGSILFYFAYFSKWFLPSTYMLLLFYSITKQKTYYRAIIGLVIIYVLMYLQTGARFEVLKVLTAIFIVHNYYVKKFTMKDLIYLLPFSILLTIFLNAISILRVQTFSYESLYSVLLLLNPSDLFYKILTETGTTSVSLANTLQYCPEIVPHGYFDFLIKLLFVLLPSFLNPFGDLVSVSTSSIFSPFVFGTIKTGYGSSFITEAYYYWGIFGYVVVFIYGLLIGKISFMCETNLKHKNICNIYLAVFLLSEIMYIVRNDVFELSRSFVYYVIVPVFLINILSKNRKLIIFKNGNKHYI